MHSRVTALGDVFETYCSHFCSALLLTVLIAFLRSVLCYTAICISLPGNSICFWLLVKLFLLVKLCFDTTVTGLKYYIISFCTFSIHNKMYNVWHILGGGRSWPHKSANGCSARTYKAAQKRSHTNIFVLFTISQLYHSPLGGEWSTSYSRKSGQASRRGSYRDAAHVDWKSGRPLPAKIGTCGKNPIDMW